MANIIETFLTTRGYNVAKRGSVMERGHGYKTVEHYEIDPQETLRGLPLTLTVETFWVSGKHVKPVANDFYINKKRIEPDQIFTALREYL